MMEISRESLELLIANQPSESLEIELKQWLDLTSRPHLAKVIRALLALRNNDGGCLLIGFKNDGSQAEEAPANIREMYHADEIQRLVKKYSSSPFDVRVEFIPFNGIDHPVICVGGGIETPVLAKGHLYEDANQENALINPNEAYVRTIQSNGTASTAIATGKDWDRLLGLCFENREANIGRFVQKHLTRDNLSVLQEVLRSGIEQSEPEADEIAHTLLEMGRQRFAERCEREGVSLTDRGMREVSAVIDGVVPKYETNPGFLNRIFANRRMHSGWTPWADSRNATSSDMRPQIVKDGYEAGIFASNVADFWRVEPTGRFYHIRLLREDGANTQSFGEGHYLTEWKDAKVLDFPEQISCTAEAISTVLTFARGMECDEENASVRLAFRWWNLEGRRLISFAENPLLLRFVWGRGPCVEHEVVADVEIPLSSARTQTWYFVERAVKRLFLHFDNTEIPSETIRHITDDVLSRDYGPG